MTKQKHGCLLFLASLIPGAGEMYMGFRKQGVSIMLLFWGVLAFGSITGIGWLIFFLPILWLYSFFNVHNLKSLSEDDFYSVEDTYILHLDQFIGTDGAIKKHSTVAAVLLIIFGVAILWNNVTDILYWLFPGFLRDFLSTIFYQLPGTVIAIAIIAAGVYLLRSGKQEADEELAKENQEEHYWEPYRPYQQPSEPDSEKSTPPTETFRTPGTETADAASLQPSAGTSSPAEASSGQEILPDAGDSEKAD